MSELILSAAPGAIPVHLIMAADWEAFGAVGAAKAAATLGKFTAKAGQLAVVPNDKGAVAQALFGLGDTASAQTLRGLSAKLPSGDYALAALPSGGGLLIAEKFYSRRAYVLIDKRGTVRWSYIEEHNGRKRDNAELLQQIAALG